MNEPKGNPVVEMEAYYHLFTHGELVELFALALEGKAAGWENDAASEDLKGNANAGKISMLKWGAVQLRQLASVFQQIPDGEIRERIKVPWTADLRQAYDSPLWSPIGVDVLDDLVPPEQPYDEPVSEPEPNLPDGGIPQPAQPYDGTPIPGPNLPDTGTAKPKRGRPPKSDSS